MQAVHPELEGGNNVRVSRPPGIISLQKDANLVEMKTPSLKPWPAVLCRGIVVSLTLPSTSTSPTLACPSYPTPAFKVDPGHGDLQMGETRICISSNEHCSQ